VKGCSGVIHDDLGGGKRSRRAGTEDDCILPHGSVNGFTYRENNRVSRRKPDTGKNAICAVTALSIKGSKKKNRDCWDRVIIKADAIVFKRI
jgi:hypothetical protein